MQLVMLGGNSQHNRDWIYRVRQYIETMFNGVYVQDYQHWSDGGLWIDMDHELTVLQSGREGYGADYGIFAKSIGAVLAAEAIRIGMIQPRFLLFCGLPYGYIKNDYQQFADVIARANVPTTIMQNENDPAGSSEEVDEYLKQSIVGRSDCHFLTTPGETHNYDDFDLIKQQLQNLLGD